MKGQKWQKRNSNAGEESEQKRLKQKGKLEVDMKESSGNVASEVSSSKKQILLTEEKIEDKALQSCKEKSNVIHNYIGGFVNECLKAGTSFC